MGILLSKLKRKKTTREMLENLEKSIKSIEENRLHTEQRQRKIVGHLILYSVAVYVIAAAAFYFLCFPASLQDQLFYITPLLIFPIIVFVLKRLVTWYYRRKLISSQEKLHDMKEEKRKLLEDVMDKETYKVAKEILEKFAPDQLRKSSSMAMPTGLSGSPDLSVHSKSTSPVLKSSSPQSLLPAAITSTSSDVSVAPGSEVRRRSLQQPPGRVWQPVSRNSSVYGTPGQTNRQSFVQRSHVLPMPRPILQRDRSYLDKLVEYLVGDGPSNRYALICKECESHNGMALKEEFEYLAFRCCYCCHWNPARKQRPQAPRLPSSTERSDLPEHTSTSELESASDTEEESDSEQPSDLESTTKQSGITISEIDAAADKVQVSEQDELPSTESTTYDKPSEDKPSSSDTEATKMSDL